MVRRISSCLIALSVLVLSVPCFATGWDDAWAMSNSLTVKTYFEQLYHPHARALIDAENQYGLRPSAEFLPVLKKLTTLPGVTAAVLSLSHPQPPEMVSVQFPENAVRLDTFDAYVLPEVTPSKSPMMHRTVGGRVRFQRASTGTGTADLLVEQGSQGNPEPNADWAVSLVLDPQWLIAQIPSAMDSLYRENLQLLFAAASPLNKLWEQSLGVIDGEDTLWWVGRKDVNILNEQALWPFESIQVVSYVHSLEKK